MTASYIVGIDLKLRLGIHFSFIRHKDVIVSLVCQSFLGIRADKDPAVKSAGCLLVEYAFEKLGVTGGTSVHIAVASMSVRDDRDIDLIADTIVAKIRGAGVRV